MGGRLLGPPAGIPSLVKIGWKLKKNYVQFWRRGRPVSRPQRGSLSRCGRQPLAAVSHSSAPVLIKAVNFLSPETWVIRGIELPWSFYCWDNSYEIWHTHRQWLGASICQLSSESDKIVHILASRHGIQTYENLIGLNLYSAKNENFQFNTWGNNLNQFRMLGANN